MDYSLNPRKMGVGPLKDQTVYVASLICQPHIITFEELCTLMSEDSTVGDADTAAVFYKARKVLNYLCSQGYIVDAGPLGKFYPTITSKAVLKAEDFKASVHIKGSQMRFVPTKEFRSLKNVEFHRVARKTKKKGE